MTGLRSLWVGARWARVLLWITAVAAGVLLAASPALAGGVRVQYPPTPGGGGLNGVQCFGGIGSCLAVGGSSKGLLVDRLTRSSWSQVPAPDPHVRGTATLNSISCTGARSCVAVGGNGCGGPLAEVWNGRVWSLADAGLPACRPRLQSVSCASGSACLAVGGACTNPYIYDCDVGGGVVERWDGRSWRPVHYKRPHPASLLGVSCPVRDGCAVVGLDSSGESVVGWWNGSRLSFLGLGDGSLGSSRGGSEQASMNGVSCTSVRFCEAVGRLGGITWNGSRWGRLRGVVSGSDAVSCVAAGDCVAIGGGDEQGTFFDRLTARRWESAQRVSGVVNIYSATALSCGSLASCVTVGVQLNGGGVAGPPMAAAGDL